MQNDKEMHQLLRTVTKEDIKAMQHIAMYYSFALKEVELMLTIWNDDYKLKHHYLPIEHMKSRIKTVESIHGKLKKKGFELSAKSVKTNILDIAGIRIVTAFLEDIKEVLSLFERSEEIRIVEVKDYISNPKDSGYQSLHVIIEKELTLTDTKEWIPIEVQLRTVAMDFWASAEHKLNYKTKRAVQQEEKDALLDVAFLVNKLDKKMSDIRQKIINQNEIE